MEELEVLQRPSISSQCCRDLSFSTPEVRSWYWISLAAEVPCLMEDNPFPISCFFSFGYSCGRQKPSSWCLRDIHTSSHSSNQMLKKNTWYKMENSCLHVQNVYKINLCDEGGLCICHNVLEKNTPTEFSNCTKATYLLGRHGSCQRIPRKEKSFPLSWYLTITCS